MCYVQTAHVAPFQHDCQPDGQQRLPDDCTLSQCIVLFPRLRHAKYGAADREALLERSAHQLVRHRQGNYESGTWRFARFFNLIAVRQTVHRGVGPLMFCEPLDASQCCLGCCCCCCCQMHFLASCKQQLTNLVCIIGEPTGTFHYTLTQRISRLHALRHRRMCGAANRK